MVEAVFSLMFFIPQRIKPIILPEVLTEKLVIEYLNKDY